MNTGRKNIVMLIDDSEIDAFINQKMIQNFGFADKVYVHHSTKSAIFFFENFERIPELPTSLLPTIIFLDLNMPEKDGFDFIDDFNKIDTKITSNIKIVFITSSTNEDDIERAKKYNVLAYLNKPLTFDKIEFIQKKLL